MSKADFEFSRMLEGARTWTRSTENPKKNGKVVFSTYFGAFPKKKEKLPKKGLFPENHQSSEDAYKRIHYNSVSFGSSR
jgi:hypothetical protein